MSEQSAVPAPETEPKAKFSRDDYFLEILALFAQHTTISFDITLTVGGFFISGAIITDKDYFAKMSVAIKNATYGSETVEGVKEAVESLFDTAASVAGEPLSETMGEAADRGHFPKYIHLDKVTVMTASGQCIPLSGMLWRGRIDKVDGFSVGRMGPTP